MTQAGLEGRFPSPERTGVVIGTGIGGMQTYEDNCKAYLTKGPDRVSPFFVPMFIPDIAAGLVSIRYGLKGPNFATVSACASSAHAIGESLNLIRHGVADAMVTGGAEAAITGLTVAAFGEPMPKFTIVSPASFVAACIGRLSPKISQLNRAANRCT